MRNRPVTIKHVAAGAGVHASTVSRVLNPQTRDMVSSEVAENVLAIANTLGYLRNPLASGLRTRRSHTVGVLIPDLTNPVFPPIIRGIERALAAEGYVAVLADSENSTKNKQALTESLLARQIDGLILATAHRRDELVEKCIDFGIPLVLVNRTVDKQHVTSVINDDELGIKLAFDHLIKLGHRRIAFVGGPQNTSTAYVRYRAFLKLVKRANLHIERNLIANSKAFTEVAGQASMNRILESKPEPFTAVITANDLLALGCLDALESWGLRCPEDISLTGFNHMRFMDRLKPRLTTVKIPHDELGVQAGLLLLEQIGQNDTPAKTIRLEPRLVIGDSTRAPSRRQRWPLAANVKSRSASRQSRASVGAR
ncbi:MAG: LacI family DNA-binding transcriptional regulator [Woeseia sp.]